MVALVTGGDVATGGAGRVAIGEAGGMRPEGFILWDPMGFHGAPSDSMGSHGVLWGSV